MSTLAIDLIRPAARRAGIIGATEQPKASQVSALLDILNGIIDEWSANPQMALATHELTVSVPAGSPSVTIGPSQTINVVRPFRIESAYARVGSIDEPIDVVDKQIYDSINLKSTGSTWPELLWYDGRFPTGSVYFWPKPASTIELHITVLDYLAQYATATTAQDLPAGYKKALWMTLAVEAAPAFQIEPSPTLIRQQMNVVRLVKRQNIRVPNLSSSTIIRSRLGQFLGGGL